MAGDSKKGSFWVGLFIGGFLGAIGIFLLATKEGKKVSKNLQKRIDELLEQIDKKITELESEKKQLGKNASMIQTQVKKRIEDKRDEVVKETLGKVDKTLTHLEDLQTKGREMTKNLHQKFFKNIPKNQTNIKNTSKK